MNVMVVPANSDMNWTTWYLYTAYTLHFVFLLVVCNTGMNGCLDIESLNYNLHWFYCVQCLALPPFHSWDCAKHEEKIKTRLENALTVANTRKLGCISPYSLFKLRWMSKSLGCLGIESSWIYSSNVGLRYEKMLLIMMR